MGTEWDRDRGRGKLDAVPALGTGRGRAIISLSVVARHIKEALYSTLGILSVGTLANLGCWGRSRRKSDRVTTR